MTQRTILTINGEVFHLAERNDLEQLSDEILSAAQQIPAFVDISIAGDGSKRILVGPSSAVKIETIEIPDGEGTAYDDAHPQFDPAYYEYDLP